VRALLLLFLPLLLAAPAGRAQPVTPDWDSLKLWLETVPADTATLAHLLGIADANYRQAPEYAEKVANRAAQVAETAGDLVGKADAHRLAGNAAYQSGNSPKALGHFLDALKVYEKMGDLQGQSRVLNNIAIIYKNDMRFDKALEYNDKSLAIKEKLGDLPGQSSSHNNIGIILNHLGEHEKALAAFEKALRIKVELGDSLGQANVMGNIADVMLAQGLRQEALERYEQTLALQLQLGDLGGALKNQLNLGSLLLDMEQDERARQLLQDAVGVAEQIGAAPIAMDCHRLLSRLDQRQGRLAEALAHHVRFFTIKDSLWNLEQDKAMAEMQARFDSEQKEKENELLRKDKLVQQATIERQNAVVTAVLVGLVLLSLLAFILISSNRARRRANLLLKEQQNEILFKNHILTKQKEEIEHQKRSVEEQKEEIQQQAEELALKNEQLEKIDHIVQTINNEVQFERLMQSITENLGQVEGVEACALLLWNPERRGYDRRAAHHWDQLERQWTPEAIQAEFFAQGRVVDQGLFLAQAQEGGLELHRVILEVDVQDKEQITEGFFILQSRQGFRQSTLNLLGNLREHLVAAYIKTQLLANLEATLKHLRETQEELVRKEKMASIGTLTQGIVDRVINPLNYINNFSEVSGELLQETGELLQELRKELPPEAEAALELADELDQVRQMAADNMAKILSHGKTATRIIKEMEALLKHKKLDFRPTPLLPLLEDALREQAQAHAAEVAPKLEWHCPEALPELPLFAPDLRQLFAALAKNAFQSLAQKQKRQPAFLPALSVATGQDPQQVWVELRDNGMGIPAANLAKIFDPLFTTKPTSEATGLGLYVAQDIAKAHRGQVLASSAEGEWASFRLVLPKAAEAGN